MKTLILGARGQLGRSFAKCDELRRRGPVVLSSRDGIVGGMDRGEIADLARPGTLPALLDRVQPNLIVNTAAYTAVDRAEAEESLATVINGEAPGVIGAWAADNHALVVHYSTDYVFDGKGTVPYAVDDKPSPLNAYGRSKLAGEQALRQSGAQHFIFRTAWVYAAHGSNFFRTMLRLAGERRELTVVGDQFGTPTTTNLIVDATMTAIARWDETSLDQRASLIGTQHLVADGVTTWRDFAYAIIEESVARGLLLPPAPLVTAIRTEDYPTPAKRPSWSVLDNSGFRQQFGITLPDWRVELKKVINELYLEANGKSC